MFNVNQSLEREVLQAILLLHREAEVEYIKHLPYSEEWGLTVIPWETLHNRTGLSERELCRATQALEKREAISVDQDSSTGERSILVLIQAKDILNELLR